MTRPCPWCLARVELVDVDELRRRISLIPGKITHPALAYVAGDFPGWWCPRCHAGGLLVGARSA